MLEVCGSLFVIYVDGRKYESPHSPGLLVFGCVWTIAQTVSVKCKLIIRGHRTHLVLRVDWSTESNVCMCV